MRAVRFYDSEFARDEISALLGRKVNFRRRLGGIEFEVNGDVATEGDWSVSLDGAIFVATHSRYKKLLENADAKHEIR